MWRNSSFTCIISAGNWVKALGFISWFSLGLIFLSLYLFPSIPEFYFEFNEKKCFFEGTFQFSPIQVCQFVTLGSSCFLFFFSWARVAFIISLLRRRALAWATTVCVCDYPPAWGGFWRLTIWSSSAHRVSGIHLPKDKLALLEASGLPCGPHWAIPEVGQPNAWTQAGLRIEKLL